MNINDITITSLETINAFDLVSGEYKFTLDELQSAKIANTQEKTDILLSNTLRNYLKMHRKNIMKW